MRSVTAANLILVAGALVVGCAQEAPVKPSSPPSPGVAQAKPTAPPTLLSGSPLPNVAPPKVKAPASLPQTPSVLPFAPPEGCAEIEAGLKGDSNDLLEQGLQVLKQEDTASRALRVIGLALLKRGGEAADAMTKLSPAQNDGPYEQALVAIAKTASQQASGAPRDEVLASLQKTEGDLKRLPGCSVALYAISRIARSAGDAKYAAAAASDGERRESDAS